MTQTLLRAMIVDDEPLAREGLRIRLKRESDVVIVGEYSDVANALKALRVDTPDVLFLDVEMPTHDGFSLLESARDMAMPAVVFVTAHERHAVRAFDSRALDYLLKPVEQIRLRESLNRVREHLDRIRQGEFGEQMRGLMRNAGVAAGGRVERIPVTTDGAIHFVTVSEIDYVEASGDVVRLYVSNEAHAVRKSMGEIQGLLDPNTFVRIHRSYIVNADRIARMEPHFHGEYIVVLTSGQRLKLSRSYRSAVAQLLGNSAD